MQNLYFAFIYNIGHIYAICLFIHLFIYLLFIHLFNIVKYVNTSYKFLILLEY